MIDIPREDVVVMLEAGYILLAMKRFKESRSLFEGVCELVPGHEVPQVALANVFFAQEKFLEAVRVLKGAVKDNPQSAFAWSHLGEAQLFYGRKEEARESLQKAVALEGEQQAKAQDFAQSLLDLMDSGYDPVEFKKQMKKAKAAGSSPAAAAE